MNPVIIKDSISVAAGATVENLIASNAAASRFIRAPYDAVCNMMCNLSATGVRLELVVDGKTIMDSSDTRVAPGAQQLVIPDDIIIETFFIRAGAQVVLRAVSTAGGAVVVNYQISMLEAGVVPPVKRYTIRGPISIPAGAVRTSLLAGLRFERPIQPSKLLLMATASAAGLQAEVVIDAQSVLPPSAIAALNRVPINPYDTLISDIEVDKDKLIELLVSNPTVGALNIFWKEELEEQAVG